MKISKPKLKTFFELYDNKRRKEERLRNHKTNIFFKTSALLHFLNFLGIYLQFVTAKF